MLHDSALLTLFALTIFSGSCEKPSLLRMKKASLHGTHQNFVPYLPYLVHNETYPTEGLPCTAHRKLLRVPIRYCTTECSLPLLWGWSLQLSWKQGPGLPPKDKSIPFTQLRRTCFLWEKSCAMAGFLWIQRGSILFIQLQMALSVPFQFIERRKYLEGWLTWHSVDVYCSSINHILKVLFK